MKNHIQTLLVVCFSAFLLIAISGCKQGDPGAETDVLSYQQLEGKTMGTYYRITYGDSLQQSIQADVTALLERVNLETSTYIDTSLISLFNQSEQGMPVDVYPPGTSQRAEHFLTSLYVAQLAYQYSDGAFDPTVMPLVNYWGFGYTPKEKVTQVDSIKVDSLLQLVGYQYQLHLTEEDQVYLEKRNPSVQLDFSACAKGAGVDALAAMLETKGIHDFLVDIGGESRAKGKSARGDIWQIGINLPLEEAGLQEVSFILPLENRAIATSGNYRNYYKLGDQTFSHTINPHTGYPERTQLLSASILASDCATADALATACMVMGVDAAKEMIEQLANIEAFFLVSTADGGQSEVFTEGFPREQ